MPRRGSRRGDPFACKVPEEPLEVAFNKYNEILAHDVKVKQ